MDFLKTAGARMQCPRQPPQMVPIGERSKQGQTIELKLMALLPPTAEM
jgi:hypothetical protein